MILTGYGNVMFNWIEGLVWNPLLLVIGLLLVANAMPNIKLPKQVENLANASMGIYLVHVLFTSGANFALQKVGHPTVSAIIGFPLMLILFLMSYFAVRFLPKKVF